MPFKVPCGNDMLREGETRYTSGVTPTDYQYTGQRNEAGIGLYYYNARWVDVSLGRFVQADTIVPDKSSRSGGFGKIE